MKQARHFFHKPITTLLPLVTLCFVMSLFHSCTQSASNPNKDLTADAFAGFVNEQYGLDADDIWRCIINLVKKDNDSTQTDWLARKLYKDNKRLLWIDTYGIGDKADTLISHLKNVGGIGFSEKSFYIADLENDIQRIRSLDFDDRANKINELMARVEYKLTKAYLRYCIGQQFGFTNPYKYLNRLDPANEDTTAKVKEYRHLFDIPMKRPDGDFYAKALNMANAEELGAFLCSVEPQNAYFNELCAKLATERNAKRRWLLLCNMERQRWKRTEANDDPKGRKVVVNIPSFRLYAYSPDSTMEMKVGCGATKTKTPLLTSEINRMDINPLWNIPMSIIKKDVAPHAGNSHYFTSRRYFIVDRNTGKTISPTNVTSSMLRSGQYRVSQEGGEGNSLGRIIFRFDNKFSVYLHDTSSRKFFEQNVRSVSHGCIRIERPFDFAQYLLGDDEDEWKLDRIRISMDLEPKTERGLKHVSDTTKSRKLINSVKVEPKVPLYIVYQTLFKTSEGKWEEYKDIYGYDAVMRKQLEPFVASNNKNDK